MSGSPSAESELLKVKASKNIKVSLKFVPDVNIK
jgi:hypothetical protein